MAVPEVSADQRATKVFVLLAQREIEVDKPDVNAGGGLIGALIETIAESNMDKNRQKALAPIRDGLVDVNIEQRFLENFNANLPRNLVREDAEFILLRDPFELEQKRVEFNGQTLMIGRFRYAFEANFNMMYFNTWVSFGDLGFVKDRKGRPTSKFKKDAEMAGKVTWVMYSSYFPLTKYVGYKEAVEQWGDNRGERMLLATHIAMGELGTLLREDFAAPSSFEENARTANVIQPGGLKLKGTVLRTKGDRTLLGILAERLCIDNDALK